MAIRKVQQVFAPSPEFLALDNAVRNALSKAMRNCSSRSRDDIARQLSECTGTNITLRMLNDLTAESRRPHRFPASWVIPFCRITGDDSLQRLLLGPNLSKVLQLGEREVAVHRLLTTIVERLPREELQHGR